MRSFAIGWTLLCIVLGIVTAYSIYQLRDAGDAIDRASSALESTGDTLSSFEDLPLIGGDVGKAGSRISSQGAKASEAAEATRQRVAIVAIYTGVLVTLLGAAPMIVMSRVVSGLQRE
jgi:CHASE3 domain sensor protein